MFSFSCSTNLIDTYVTVPIDVAHIPRLLFYLYLHFSDSCVYVSKHLLTFSLLIHIRAHLSIYSCVWFV